jgi:putative membrane protein
MKLNTIYAYTASAVLLTISSGALAQKSVNFSRDGRPERIFGPASGVNPDDSNFLKKAACINMFEIEAAKIAVARGDSEFTKEYAKEMMAEHQQSLDQLKEVAANKGVQLPGDLPAAQQKTINFLSGLSGPSFDAAYRRTQISGHAMASSLFKNEIGNGHDEDVKAYAVETLPEVAMHYRMAEEQKTMMGPTKGEHI